MTDQWIYPFTEGFWESAGGLEPFPRDLEHSALWALPVAVVKLPRLWVKEVQAWLAQRSIPFGPDSSDRPLRGFLMAYGGKGLILLDGTDSEEERRFSLAHEIAHFMLDYRHPRHQAVNKLDESILEVFDGLRPPTVQERIDATLSNVPIGVHTHLMERIPDGFPGCSRVLGAEDRADRLALELLAPSNEVQRHIWRSSQPPTFDERVKVTEQTLASDFGLPLSVACIYARWLCRKWYGGPSLREWLGI